MLKATFLHLIDPNIAVHRAESQKCKTCMPGKQTRVSRRVKKSRVNSVTAPVERVYTDVLRPVKSSSLRRSTYFVTLLYGFSGYLLVRFMHRKSEKSGAVIAMISELENLFNARLKELSCIIRNNVK